MDNFLPKFIADALKKDPVGDAITDARIFYEDNPSDYCQTLAKEFRAAERLYKSGSLPKDKAIRLLRDHADRLDEIEWDIQASEVRKIIDDQSIDENS